MFVLDRETLSQTLPSGARRKVKGYLPDLMLCEITWKSGMKGSIHQHEHRQCLYVISGQFEVIYREEKRILSIGDCLYTEKDEPHGLYCLEDGIVLDIFTPMRKDFVTDPKQQL